MNTSGSQRRISGGSVGRRVPAETSCLSSLTSVTSWPQGRRSSRWRHIRVLRLAVRRRPAIHSAGSRNQLAPMLTDVHSIAPASQIVHCARSSATWRNRKWRHSVDDYRSPLFGSRLCALLHSLNGTWRTGETHIIAQWRTVVLCWIRRCFRKPVSWLADKGWMCVN